MRKFAVVALELEDEVFVVYTAFISQNSNVHLFWKIHILFLKAYQAANSILFKYADFANVFFNDLVAKLSKHIKIKDYTINLIKGYQPFYRPIYSLVQLELEILKTYIKIDLANSFI